MVVAVAAYCGRHAGAHNRKRLENAGAEYVQDVREKNRPDQRGLLQILQGHHTRGLRARGQNPKSSFPGPHQRSTYTGPEAGSDHFHPQTV